MDTEIPVLLKDFAAALRTICGDPDLSVLLYNPPLENHDLLVSTTVRSTIPEFSSDEAAWSFVHAEFKGRPLACEPRQRVSADGHSILLEVPFAVLVSRAVSADDAQWERREFPSALSAGIPEGFLCIGASSLPPIQTVLRLWNLDGDEICQEDVLGDLTSLAARLFCRVFDLTRSLRDPVSQLPGRTEYESVLKSALVQAARDQQPLGVLLINPDDFVMVNHRYGREKGDGALREIARRLGSCMRNSDRLFRCGGAAFGLILPATSLEKVEIVAHKFQRALSDEAYLDGGLDLTFTVGGATVNPEDLPLESSTPPNLIRLAEHALHKAKLAGDAGVLLISIADASDDINHFHPDSGIFTADAEKDYRNMLLLWESVAMVSSIPDPVALAQAFVDLLHTRFWTDGVTLVRCGEDNTLEVIATRRRDQTDVSEHLIPDKELDTARLSLVRRASQTREMEQITEPSDGEDSARLTYALPLMAAEKNVGCLLIDGNETLLHLDATDLIFVNALSNQVALALDRFELVASQIQKTEQEKRELRREVLELRHALHHSKLVYESKVMEDVMQTLRRIAPTDVTILIVGESGTGKELLARAVHEYSRRSETPLVTVDCGAITHSLFEAELFGYKKGAYTGAHAASEGRILQADGGTLFLDEVGELPLDVQAKLLRFVQEHEFTPVGNNKSRHVDVRIIAATNRDLEQEVAAGRFREDLYYRLQVVTLRAAPLRERREDTLPIARFFLEGFSHQHDSICTRFGEDAERLLLTHDWPGNIRELQHCVLRSVLMCDDEALCAGDIHLQSEQRADSNSNTIDSTSATVSRISSQGQVVETQSAYGALRVCLIEQLEHALTNNPNHPVPIGRWLQEDLVLTVSAHNDNVGRRAAEMVGVPESTFRRQLEKARAELAAGIAARSNAWQSVSVVLESLVNEAARGESEGLLDKVRCILLEIVKTQTVGRQTIGAALMGVTPPTYKRWLANEERAA